MTLAPDLLTALGMTALSAWSLAWVMWLLGRAHWRQGLAQAVLSLICFGTAYFCFGLDSRVRHSGLQFASVCAIGWGISFFTLALHRFRQNHHTLRDALTWALPALASILLAAWLMPVQLALFNRLHVLITLTQMLNLLVILWRMRAHTPGAGWLLVTTAMLLQTLSLLPLLFMTSNAATMAVQDSTLWQQIGRWAACMAMFLNLVVTSMGFLLMQRDRQLALEQDKARLDHLTLLPLRGALLQHLQHTIAQAHQAQTPLSLLMIDIDHFKRINDTYGHLTGDRVIQRVADTLRAQLRHHDMAARYGGEEFVLVLPATDACAAQALAQRLCEHVRSMAVLLPNGATLHITISVGVYSAQPDAAHTSWEAWMGAADAAMYQAKQSGRDCVVLHPPLLATAA